MTLQTEELLPYLLAGPILRRSSSDAIWVWFATSQPVATAGGFELEIFDSAALPSAEQLRDERFCSQAIGASYKKTLGKDSKILSHEGAFIYLQPHKNVHIYLLKAIAKVGKFPTGKRLFYEVFLVEQITVDGKQKVIRYGFHEHLNKSSKPVPDWREVRPIATRGYNELSKHKDKSLLLPFDISWRSAPIRPKTRGPDFDKIQIDLPSFVLDANNGLTKVWAGSCLKLHGLGLSATSLMYEHEFGQSKQPGGLLAERFNQPSAWPNALFLMGDQIYADDVSFILFEGVKELARRIEGDFREKIPGGRIPSEITATKRFDYVKLKNEITPFTLDEDAQNQLFTQAEFCAYYLLHFNAALWPDLECAETKAKISMVESDWKADKIVKRLKVEKERLETSRRTARDYCSVMASVPVYAMCDDHEVTDDWFINKKWIDGLGLDSSVSPLKITTQKNHEPLAMGPKIGRWIVSNALSTYACFQAIGNDPDQFFQRVKGLTSPIDKQHDSDRNLHELLATDWSFVTPTATRAIFLDTRTQRHSGNQTGMKLSEKTEKKYMSNDKPVLFNLWLTNETSLRRAFRYSSNEDFLMLVTPSPVLSSGAEELKWQFGSSNKDSADADTVAARLDDELWRSNYSNYFWLLDMLINRQISRCVFLSGDVHYGYRYSAKVFYHADSSAKPLGLELDQIVTSPLLNQFEKKYGDGESLFITAGTKFGTSSKYSFKYILNSETRVCEQYMSSDELPKGRPFYGEKIQYMDCSVANQDEVTAVTRNHFVELDLGTNGVGDVKYFCHKLPPSQIPPRTVRNDKFV
jgi:hypothetical protein